MKSSQLEYNIPTQGIIDELLISRICHSKFLLRDFSTSLEDLKSSIAEKGLLHPILVRPIGEKFEVIAGNRRLAACKDLAFKRITCHVLDLEDKDAFEVSLMENLQHRTLNAIEEATAFKRYVAEYGWGGISELARKIGKSHSYVSNRIRLLDLPKEVLDKIVCRQTNPGVIQEVLGLANDQKRQALAEEILEHGLTRAEVRRKLQDEKNSEIDSMTSTHLPSQKEMELREKDKAVLRFVTSLRIALMRLDDTLDGLDRNDWTLWQVLMHYRSTLHKSIDELIILRKKSRIYHDKLESIS